MSSTSTSSSSFTVGGLLMVVRMDVGAQEIGGNDRESVPRQTSDFDINYK